MGLYNAVNKAAGDGFTAAEGPPLCGFQCGNRYQPGCLTLDPSARIHSCEPGTGCETHNLRNIVWLIPIVSRAPDGSVMRESGAGGGNGDLAQIHELDLSDRVAVTELLKLCAEKVDDPQTQARILWLVEQALTSETKSLHLETSNFFGDREILPIGDLATLLQGAADRKSQELSVYSSEDKLSTGDYVLEPPNLLPKRIVSCNRAVIKRPS